MKLKKADRQPFYILVENLLRRPITKEEHQMIKSALLEHSAQQSKMIEDLNTMLQLQGSRRKVMAQKLYKAIRKLFNEDDLIFLKNMAE